MRSTIFLSMISLIGLHINAMDINVRNPNIYQVQISGGTVVENAFVSRVKDPRTSLNSCQFMAKESKCHAAIVAVEQGALEPVRSYLGQWCHWIQAWDRYDRDIELLITHALEFPVEKTGNISDFVLSKLRSPDVLTQPDCVLKKAIDNRHVPVIAYMHAKFPELTRWELIESIQQNKDGRVAHLLQAGVDPNSGIGDPEKELVAIERDEQERAFQVLHGVQYPLHTAIWRGHSRIAQLLLKHGASLSQTALHGLCPLDIALIAFTKQKESDDAAKVQQRLSIVRTLLKKMDDDAIPSRQYIQERISELPQETQAKIMALHADRLVPRPCMSEDAPATFNKEEEDYRACGITLMMLGGCARTAVDICMNWKKIKEAWPHRKTDASDGKAKQE